MLAQSENKIVLQLWQGLGYNRRALSLKRAAEIVYIKHKGIVPNTKDKLLELPGIGDATAGAIMCYAFGKPIPFIETNIRTVYIHEFINNKKNVSDRELLPYVTKTLDSNNPREWFYAVTDYGVYLKKTVGNKSRRSKHYTKQSKFEGSNRQKRSKILKAILINPMSLEEIKSQTKLSDKEINKPLNQLIDEKFIIRKRDKYHMI